MSMATRLFASETTIRPADQAAWGAARTLADLAELTAQWLERRIGSQPGYDGPCDVDPDPSLWGALVQLNRAGFLTRSSQPGRETVVEGHAVTQNAAVRGYIDPTDNEWLVALDGLFVVEGWACPGRASRSSPLYLTRTDGRGVTDFGYRMGRYDIAGEFAGCSAEAIAAVGDAVQIVVYDRLPARNTLWPALAHAAGRRLT